MTICVYDSASAHSQTVPNRPLGPSELGPSSWGHTDQLTACHSSRKYNRKTGVRRQPHLKGRRRTRPPLLFFQPSSLLICVIGSPAGHSTIRCQLDSTEQAQQGRKLTFATFPDLGLESLNGSVFSRIEFRHPSTLRTQHKHGSRPMPKSITVVDDAPVGLDGPS